MSCVESLSYAASTMDLKDLDTDGIKLFENYKFKDPSDISNNLQISRSKEKVLYLYIFKYTIFWLLRNYNNKALIIKV